MENENKKVNVKSRKFIAWIVTTVIVAIVLICCSLVLLINKTLNTDVSTAIIDLIKTALTFYFWTTLVYMGVNAGQKIGLAGLSPKENKENDNE